MIPTNIWKTFSGLMPSRKWLIGNVTAHNADGTSTFYSLDGQLIRPIGQDVEVGGMAFVEDGRIIGAAPELESVEQSV